MIRRHSLCRREYPLPSRIIGRTESSRREWADLLVWRVAGSFIAAVMQGSDAALLSPYRRRGIDVRFHVAFLKPPSICYTSSVRSASAAVPSRPTQLRATRSGC